VQRTDATSQALLLLASDSGYILQPVRPDLVGATSLAGSIIVVEKGKPVGILTERDISTKVAKDQKIRGMVVRNIMSQAVEQMVRKDIRRLPVMEDDRLLGMVTERDVFRYLIMVSYAPNIPKDLGKLIETRTQAHALSH
jgi:CBS domain-containing protein